MVSKDPRSLPDWIEQAYEIIKSRIAASDDTVSREQAKRLLVDHDNFPNEVTDAIHAIDRLLDTGWLYEANDALHITDPDE